MGSSYNIVARSDRDIGQHGGLLFVDTKHKDIKIVDTSNTEYPFSLSCCIHGHIHSFFALIYNPPASSPHQVDPGIQYECIYLYNNKVAQLKEKFRLTNHSFISSVISFFVELIGIYYHPLAHVEFRF